MGFRKVRGKKYNSIYEYYKNADPDKRTVAYYIMRPLHSNDTHKSLSLGEI